MNTAYDTVASRDEEAVRRLVADNLNLVRKEARRQAAKWAGDEPAGVQEELCRDLVQAGVAGLRRAAEKFRPELGNKFSTYAMPWIRKTVGEAAREWRETYTHISLDAPVGEDGEATGHDLYADEGAADPSEAADAESLREYARRLLATLPERDRAMVEMRFGIATGVPATLREVGKAFGVSTTRADKVINRALLRLRAAA